MSWIPVKGYENKYSVSEEGEVMSWNFAKKHLPRTLKQRMNRRYMTVCLRKGGSRSFFVHHLVAEAFIGPRPNGMVLNHIDGDRKNNSSSNLEYVTPSENAKHACKLYLIDSRGEKHSQHKLTEEQVKEILCALKMGAFVGELAKKYSIHQSQISHIKAGRGWRHIDRKAG